MLQVTIPGPADVHAILLRPLDRASRARLKPGCRPSTDDTPGTNPRFPNTFRRGSVRAPDRTLRRPGHHNSRPARRPSGAPDTDEPSSHSSAHRRPHAARRGGHERPHRCRPCHRAGPDHAEVGPGHTSIARRKVEPPTFRFSVGHQPASSDVDPDRYRDAVADLPPHPTPAATDCTSSVWPSRESTKAAHQPRARHCGIDGRSLPRVESLPWPG
jgi:hypothetical protein